jgi:hypothetical protein
MACRLAPLGAWRVHDESSFQPVMAASVTRVWRARSNARQAVARGVRTAISVGSAGSSWARGDQRRRARLAEAQARAGRPSCLGGAWHSIKHDPASLTITPGRLRVHPGGQVSTGEGGQVPHRRRQPLNAIGARRLLLWGERGRCRALGSALEYSCRLGLAV